MRSYRVVVAAPGFDDDLGFFQRVEDFPIQSAPVGGIFPMPLHGRVGACLWTMIHRDAYFASNRLGLCVRQLACELTEIDLR